MLVEDRRDIVFRGRAASDFDAFLFGIPHAAAYSGPDDGKLKLREYRTHLDEDLAHGIDVAVLAINRDAAHDDHPELPGIDRGTVLNMVFLISSLAEQKRIVARLEGILPLCERLK